MSRHLVFFSKNNSMKNKKQYKLHKKWLFFKVLKQTFFKKKSKYFFTKLSKFFYQKKLLLFYFYNLYGRGVKSTMFAKYKKKHICGKRFIFFLNLVELRLNVFIVRIHFVYKIIEANYIIKKGFIYINNKIVLGNKFINIYDVVQKKTTIIKTNKRLNSQKKIVLVKQNRKKTSFIKNWRRFLRKKRVIKHKFFWKYRINILFNCIEVNYKIFTCILLRAPMYKELILRSRIKSLDSTLLKQLYLLY